MDDWGITGVMWEDSQQDNNDNNDMWRMADDDNDNSDPSPSPSPPHFTTTQGHVNVMMTMAMTSLAHFVMTKGYSDRQQCIPIVC